MSEFDTGMGTTPGMWEMVSDALSESNTKLPDSVNEAIYALRDDRAAVVLKREEKSDTGG